MYFATTKAHKVYSDVSYRPDCYLMFGRKAPASRRRFWWTMRTTCIRIPMWGDIRSLNLSNSAAIVLYEALRQGMDSASWS
ncbi:MAG: tRNA (cytidine(34)-2'-O)-methyltransferase [Enterocloster clostridioformis]